jgi:hypothetical protein
VPGFAARARGLRQRLADRIAAREATEVSAFRVRARDEKAHVCCWALGESRSYGPNDANSHRCRQMRSVHRCSFDGSRRQTRLK